MSYLNKKDFDFPTTTEYTKVDVQKVQSELLVMVRHVCSILERNNIPYFMAYGTLIGAIKFEGFLPWDDDIDLFLFDETYNKAIRHLEDELPPHLIVHSEKNDKKYFLAWNSVKNLNVKVEAANIYNLDNKLLGFRNLGIDLYKLKKVKLSELESYRIDEARLFFERKHRAGIINKNELEINIEKLISKKENTNTIHYKCVDYVYTFVVKMNKPIHPDDIFPLKKIKFENLELFCPNNPMCVLESSFNKIESMPSYEERRPHLRKVIFY